MLSIEPEKAISLTKQLNSATKTSDVLKYKLILLITLYYCQSLNAQPKVFQDSLARYSYLLFGSTELNHPKNAIVVRGQQATGFFIKKNRRIYFITAKHAVTNYVANGDNRKNYPDSFNVYAHYDDPFHYISIPAIWSTASSALKAGLKETDLFCYEVTHKLNGMHVSTIELPVAGDKLVSFQNNYERLRIFGFPVNMDKIEDNVMQITPPYRFETNNFRISQNFLNQIGNDVGIDSIRYEIGIKNTRITSAFGGFSGAPVFIEDKASGKWFLLGVLVALNELRNAMYVVKMADVFLFKKFY